MSEINWTEVLDNEYEDSINVRLASLDVGEAHAFTFESVRQVGDRGHIVATVSSETAEGNTLWLAGQHGPQNGLRSLVKAAGGDPENIEGRTFTYTRVESDKSIAGYAHLWQSSE